MARALDKERAALAEEEERLAQRRKALEARERDEAIKLFEKAGMLKLSAPQIDRFIKRVAALGWAEVEKRLSA